MSESRIKRNERYMRKLAELFTGRKSMLIVLQDFPDPDAIGAAAALRELGRANGEMACSIAMGGVVGRSENRALVRYLGLNLLDVKRLAVRDYDLIALVDTQPGTGNNSLPDDVTPHIVIDHHPMRKRTRSVEFHDIRSRYGSSSTILYEYLATAAVAMPAPIATALLYGIRSDTNDLGREATQADIDAFLALYPVSNKRILGRIAMERLPRDYFRIMTVALLNARTYGRCIVTNLGRIENPDMIGEVADLLMRNEESTWAMCYGLYGGMLLMSLRTSEVQSDAGRTMHRVVGRRGTGGGHNAMAGGQVPTTGKTRAEVTRMERSMVRRLLRLLGELDRKGERLVEPVRSARVVAAPRP